MTCGKCLVSPGARTAFVESLRPSVGLSDSVSLWIRCSAARQCFYSQSYTASEDVNSSRGGGMALQTAGGARLLRPYERTCETIIS